MITYANAMCRYTGIGTPIALGVRMYALLAVSHPHLLRPAVVEHAVEQAPEKMAVQLVTERTLKRREKVLEKMAAQPCNEKTCNRCQVLKPIEMFMKHPRTIGGYNSICTQCVRDKIDAAVAMRTGKVRKKPAPTYVGIPAGDRHKSMCEIQAMRDNQIDPSAFSFIRSGIVRRDSVAAGEGVR